MTNNFRNKITLLVFCIILLILNSCSSKSEIATNDSHENDSHENCSVSDDEPPIDENQDENYNENQDVNYGLNCEVPPFDEECVIDEDAGMSFSPKGDIDKYASIHYIRSIGELTFDIYLDKLQLLSKKMEIYTANENHLYFQFTIINKERNLETIYKEATAGENVIKFNTPLSTVYEISIAEIERTEYLMAINYQR